MKMESCLVLGGETIKLDKTDVSNLCPVAPLDPASRVGFGGILARPFAQAVLWLGGGEKWLPDSSASLPRT